MIRAACPRAQGRLSSQGLTRLFWPPHPLSLTLLFTTLLTRPLSFFGSVTGDSLAMTWRIGERRSSRAYRPRFARIALKNIARKVGEA